MLSRIADSLYWMARYLERVDNTARLIEINVLHMLEAEDAVTPEAHWRPLLGISNGLGAYAAMHPDGAVTEARVIRFMTQTRENPNSIRACLRLARDNARVVRDRLSREMWEIMNELWLRAEPQLDEPDVPESMVRFCRFVRSEVARFHGVTVSTMMRGEAFAFYQIGTFVERADMTARILDVKYHLLLPELSLVGSALDYYQWAALLRSLSGFEAYRRAHQAGFSPVAVAEFVVRSPDFPRSLRFSVDRIRQALDSVGGGQDDEASQEVAGLAERVGPSATPVLQAGMHEFLTDVMERVAAVDSALHAGIFAAAPEVWCGT